jgi:small subunit ribosomal protein S2
MDPFVYTARDGVHIFDLAISAQKLVEAMEFVRDWVKEGKTLAFIGTKRQARAIIKEEATKVGAPYVSERWLGGTLTNWEEISKRIEKLREMKQKKETGGYEKYTKKENVLIDREISKLDRFLGGLSDLRKAPEALFIVDTHKESVVVKEAKVKNVPVVGMVDTNADPDMVNKIIPANDDAVRSIKLVVEKIAQAYADGKALQKKVSSNPQKPEEKQLKK